MEKLLYGRHFGAVHIRSVQAHSGNAFINLPTPELSRRERKVLFAVTIIRVSLVRPNNNLPGFSRNSDHGGAQSVWCRYLEKSNLMMHLLCVGLSVSERLKTALVSISFSTVHLHHLCEVCT